MVVVFGEAGARRVVVGGLVDFGGGPFVRSRFWRSFDSTGHGGRQGTHPRRAHTHRVRVEGIKVLGVLRYVGYVCMYLYGCWDVLYFYVLCMDVWMYGHHKQPRAE